MSLICGNPQPHPKPQVKASMYINIPNIIGVKNTKQTTYDGWEIHTSTKQLSNFLGFVIER